MPDQFPVHQSPTTNATTPFPTGETVDQVPGGYDDLVEFHGVKLVHYRAMRCPIGLSDPYDQRLVHPDHSGCSNGFLYTKMGVLTGMFTNNANRPQDLDVGMADSSNANCTLSRFYDELDCEGCEVEVSVAPFDRLFLAEENVTVVNWQLFSVSGQQTDLLAFPLVTVDGCIDSEGRSYAVGTDIAVSPEGLLVWTGSDRPGIDFSTGKGKVVSIRYQYRPFWYVTRMQHEIRVAQITDMYTGERKVIQINQSVGLQREYVYRNKQNDQKSLIPNDMRQSQSPSEPGFGPR